LGPCSAAAGRPTRRQVRYDSLRSPDRKRLPWPKPEEPAGDEVAQSGSGASTAPQAAGVKHGFGIGASAEAFEAFGELLKCPPQRYRDGVSCSLASRPHHASALAELLGHRTKSPVVEVSQGPWCSESDIRDSFPTPHDHRARHSQLDAASRSRRTIHAHRFLFALLAQDQKGNAIESSFPARPPTAPLPEGHQVGGRDHVCQDESAKFDGMPRNAVVAGVWFSFCPPDGLPGSWGDAEVIHTQWQRRARLPGDARISEDLRAAQDHGPE